MLLAVGWGRLAVQACPLHACSCVWKPSSSHLLMCKHFADKPWAKQCFFFPEEMFVLSDINILCISARLWLQVGSPKRLRSNLKKTVCFPPSLFSLSILRKWYICLEYCLSSRFRSIKFWPGMTHLLPMISQGISRGRGLRQFPETVPFFP